MKRTLFKSKRLLVLSLVLVVTLLSIGFTMSSSAADSSDNVWTFTTDNVADPMYVKQYFNDLPGAYEAEVYFPNQSYSYASPIIANYPNNSAFDCFGFEIHGDGSPAVYYYTSNYNTSTCKVEVLKSYIKFDGYKVYGATDWVRLTVNRELKDGGDVYTLYVNGEAKQTKTVDTYEMDALYSQGSTRELSIGNDGVNHFKGQLRNVAVYENSITEADAAKTAKENWQNGNTNVLAYYDATMDGNYDGFIKDQTGNGYDASKAFYERKEALRDYEYSFAFVGDTQFLVNKDVNSGTKYTASIYDWILENKDSKKIGYVFGLGDITETGGTEQWNYALGLHQKLGKELPYAIISGNHETVSQFDAAFANEPTFTDNISGYYKSGSVGNYYSKFEVGGHKYMVVAMEYGANDSILVWANSVVAANPDRRVIVITHNLLGFEGQWTEKNTREQSTTDSANSSRNNGIDIWNDFLSLHENIVIAACGHICPEQIKHRTDVGVNGNTVHTFLIDPQGLDTATQFKTGMVAMFYFSEDGSDVQVEYVSAYKTLEAQDADPTADDVLFNEVNQFSFEIDFNESGVISTEYGDLSVSEANNSENAFAMFSNKECIGVYKTWNATTKALLTYLKANKGADVQILLLKDYNNLKDSLETDSFNHANGNLVIDLNDYTFTVNATFLNLNNYYNVGNADTVNIQIKDGTVLCGNRAIIANQINNVGSDKVSTYPSEKQWNLTFDNVTLGYAAGSTYTTAAFYEAMTNSATNDDAQLGTKTKIIFNNCTFDIKNNLPTKTEENGKTSYLPFTLFALKDNRGLNKVDVTVNINGGKILASGLDWGRITFYTKNDGIDTDSILFGKDSNGAYTKLVTPSTKKDFQHYAKTFPTAEGEKYFVEISDNGSQSVYELRYVKDYKQSYEYVLEDGTTVKIDIPLISENSKCLSAVDYPGVYEPSGTYPFLVFDQTGKCYGAFDYLYGAQAGAMGNAIYTVLGGNDYNPSTEKYNAGAKTAYILMRSDYTMKKVNGSDEYFNNLAHARGKVVIDMQGHSLIADSTRSAEAIFNPWTKAWPDNPMGDSIFSSYFEIKNGTIKTYNNYVVAFKTVNAGKNADGTVYAIDVSKKLMSWKFENVTFGVVNSSATSKYIFHVKGAEKTTSGYGVSPLDLTLNDCTFDYRVTSTNSNFKLIGPYFHVNNAKLKANIQVNGGRLLANSLNKITFAEFIHQNSCTLSFGPGSDGKYFSAILPEGVDVSKLNTTSSTFDGIKTEKGTKLTFVKNTVNSDGTILYRLRPVALADASYSPKMSITLGSEFVINVYVPMDCTQKFTFNGVTYSSENNFGGKTETLDDGKTYYLVTASLGSAKAASELKLVAEVDVNGTAAKVTFTFSIPKYAEKLIANGTTAEQQLAKDVLAYIKEAYNYVGFASLNSAAEIARVNALITAIIGDYTATPTTSGTTAKDNSGIVTDVALNLDSKPTIRFYVTDMNITFKSGNRVLEVKKNESEKYIELNVYAYALCETITFGDGGSYHISSYVANATGESYEALVKAFVKYTESAADYRRAVIGV